MMLLWDTSFLFAHAASNDPRRFACFDVPCACCVFFWGWGGGWGGVGCLRSLHFVHYMLLRCRDLWDRCYVTCCYVADGVGVGGWGGVGCLRSLHFVHFMLLRCRDLWDRCYVTCCYVADGVGWVGGVGWDVNVPCTSFWHMLGGWVGWGGMFTFLALRTLERSLGSLQRHMLLRILMVWGGVGWGGVGCRTPGLRGVGGVVWMWGGMFTFLALRTFHVATL